MKTILLIIFLLVQTCLAQTETNIKFYNPPTSFIDSSMIKAIQKLIIQTEINLWDSYQKECYADSTKECFNVYAYEDKEYFTRCSKRDFDLGFNRAYKGTRDIWVHKQPTFNDFMNYLKRREK